MPQFGDEPSAWWKGLGFAGNAVSYAAMAKRRVRLTWEGKAEALASLDAAPPPCELEEETLSASHGGQAVTAELSCNINRIIHGDALAVARALELQGLGGHVDVVYLDPPYASGVDYQHEERHEGGLARA